MKCADQVHAKGLVVVVTCFGSGEFAIYRKHGTSFMKLLFTGEDSVGFNSDSVAIIEESGTFVDQILVFVSQH